MPNPGDALGTFATWITPRLATGGSISSDQRNVQILKDAGVTWIVDCQIETDDSKVLALAGFAYLFNGVPDDGQPKGADWFSRTLAFALPLLAQPNQRGLLHCAAGINRGPSSLYAVLRAVGVPPQEAMSLLKIARPQVNVAYAADVDRAIPGLGYG